MRRRFSAVLVKGIFVSRDRLIFARVKYEMPDSGAVKCDYFFARGPVRCDSQ